MGGEELGDKETTERKPYITAHTTSTIKPPGRITIHLGLHTIYKGPNHRTQGFKSPYTGAKSQYIRASTNTN